MNNITNKMRRKCKSAVIGKDNEKNMPLGPRLMKLPNNAYIH